MRHWLRTLLEAAKGWNADNAFKHSAAVSFYTLFSLAPVTVIAIGVAGLFFGREVAAKQFSAQMTQLLGDSSAQVIQRVMEAKPTGGSSPSSTALGIGLLIIGATTVFAQLQASLNEILGVVAKPSRHGWMILIGRRLISFAMVLTVGFLLLSSLILTTALTAVLEVAAAWLTIAPWVAHTADLFSGLVIITILFALLFKVLPDAHMGWRDA